MDETQERLRIFNTLTENPSWCEVLAEALAVEEQKEKEYQEAGYGQFIGWLWSDVHAAISTLNRMVVEKLLDITLSTRSSKHFKVRNPELIREALEFFKQEEERVEAPKEIPDDLFANIVGHGNIKSLLRLAIEAENPAHVLLSGPPASSKTLFLLELNRLPDSYYALGPTLTEAGLSNLLFIYRPRFLVIDEVDKLPASELGQLNSLMATGRVVETKWGKTRSVDLNTKVFAAGIRINRLPQDLLSRFIKLRFLAYSEAEFISVGTTVLTTREGIVPERAEEISRAVWQMHQEQSDIRQVVSIARLSGGDPKKVKEVLQTIRKYGLTRLDQALG
jgi:Holliday junction DNA helicase RuvB